MVILEDIPRLLPSKERPVCFDSSLRRRLTGLARELLLLTITGLVSSHQQYLKWEILTWEQPLAYFNNEYKTYAILPLHVTTTAHKLRCIGMVETHSGHPFATVPQHAPTSPESTTNPRIPRFVGKTSNLLSLSTCQALDSAAIDGIHESLRLGRNAPQYALSDYKSSSKICIVDHSNRLT